MACRLLGVMEQSLKQYKVQSNFGVVEFEFLSLLFSYHKLLETKCRCVRWSRRCTHVKQTLSCCRKHLSCRTPSAFSLRKPTWTTQLISILLCLCIPIGPGCPKKDWASLPEVSPTRFLESGVLWSNLSTLAVSHKTSSIPLAGAIHWTQVHSRISGRASPLNLSTFLSQ